MTREVIPLDGAGPGARYEIVVHRFGRRGARPKVYVQGGLHADEGPGMIAAMALIDRLAALDARGAVLGEIVVVPAANPIGLNQRAMGAHLGRYDQRDGVNFNRGFPDLAPMAASRLTAAPGGDAGANVAAIRAALAAALAECAPRTPTERLKHLLLGLALDADIALDLHCDGEALMHLYTLTALADRLAPLAARLGARALLTADVSGLNPFDEALSRPWADLAARFPAAAIPLACVAATLELRGESDVAAPFAEADAAAILDHLADEGVLGIAAPPPPAPLCAATALAATDPLASPVAGIVAYRAALGDSIAVGDAVAEVLDPVTGARTMVRAATGGVLFARAAGRVAEAGRRLGKIAGATPLRAGPLLSP